MLDSLLAREKLNCNWNDLVRFIPLELVRLVRLSMLCSHSHYYRHISAVITLFITIRLYWLHSCKLSARCNSTLATGRSYKP
jgi:hypothetical protein